MRTALKIVVLSFCFHFCTIRVLAQTDEKAFYGSWELDQSGYYGKQEPQVRYIKIFNADHSFSNLQTHAATTFTSHSGKYQVKNDDTYIERSLYVKEGMDFVFKDKDVIIHYHFSDDKKLLILSFTVQNGAVFTERWKRSDQVYAGIGKAKLRRDWVIVK